MGKLRPPCWYDVISSSAANASLDTRSERCNVVKYLCPVISGDCISWGLGLGLGLGIGLGTGHIIHA